MSLGLPVDYVLYDMSYANLLLYSASLPSYRSPKDKNGRQGETIDAGDRRNKDKVRAFLNAID